MKYMIITVVILFTCALKMFCEETEEENHLAIPEDPYPSLPLRNYSCNNMACPLKHICGCMPTPITPETPFRDLDCGCYHEFDMMPVCV
uniref:U-scoloptoxin(12)-Sa1a n=1 Tax=Scolopendra alternans TaxID=1329349 RepID=TXC1A_SCOAL|nr:RecName: Full=U-scoloptoxin(12)-Sa1a; Short=U-SLPTX(12)-Sa1a; Flags: Precursor [Scolopendra alternans]